MPAQEMLVSYGVKIDEAGISRLHTLLSQNRQKAGEAAIAFDRAEKALGKLASRFADVIRFAPQNLTGLWSTLTSLPSDRAAQPVRSDRSDPTAGPYDPERAGVLLSPSAASSSFAALISSASIHDPGKQERDLSRFTSALSLSITSALRHTNQSSPLGKVAASRTDDVFPLAIDTSAVESSMATVSRLINANAPTLHITANTSGLISAASNAVSRVRSILSGVSLNFGSLPELKLATGGRFSAPTHAEIAEDGDPEYVIPVKKTSRALPLIRQMLGELPAQALTQLRLSLSLPGPSPSPGAILSPTFSLPGLTRVAPVHISNNTTVTAPCSVSVQSAVADPVAVGHSVYDLAERQLLRSLRSVFD